jgi:hypothetical protein
MDSAEAGVFSVIAVHNNLGPKQWEGIHARPFELPRDAEHGGVT